MRLKLILKKIISNVKTKNLTKTDATELIISLIEKSENAEVRAACIDSLVTLNVKTEKVYNKKISMNWKKLRITNPKHFSFCFFTI